MSFACTLACAGLPEYQVLGNTYEVTLIRATGRMGDWGTFPSAPSSHEPGLHAFEYAVMTNDGKGARACAHVCGCQPALGT